MAERMGIDYSNLAKCASIASRYELLLRSKTLSFKHHQIAAPLDDRTEWLKRAQENNWTTAELAKQIRQSKIEKPEWDSVKPIIAFCGKSIHT
ncbi:hypothetical protein M1O56_00875 [Dehalococcoidia bacterium]|nr:hypothetical protein [Dehalococcoidia bacterium]